MRCQRCEGFCGAVWHGGDDRHMNVFTHSTCSGRPIAHCYMNSEHWTPKRWATRNNRSFQSLCNGSFINLCVMSASNPILAIAFELIVQVIGIVVRSRWYALFSRIRFISAIVGAIVGNEIEKWRERRRSNERRRKERRKKKKPEMEW